MFVLWLVHFYKRQYDAFGNVRPLVHPMREELFNFYMLLLDPETVMNYIYHSEASSTYY